MAYSELYGELICKCDVCDYVWIARNKEMPARCGKTGKHHCKWNAGKVLRDKKEQLNKTQEVKNLPDKKVFEVNQEIAVNDKPDKVCIHGREAKFCTYCAITKKKAGKSERESTNW